MLRVWGLGLVEGLGFWVFLVSGFRVRGFRGFVVSGLDKVQGFWFSFLGENEAHHICVSVVLQTWHYVDRLKCTPEVPSPRI